MFEDRSSAGFILAKKLEKFAKRKNVLVLGMARGGVAVAKVISTYLNVPLDVLVVKKIGAPNNPELAIGAIGPKRSVFWNRELVAQLKIKPVFAQELRRGKEKERKEQEKALRGNKGLEILGKTVILVDDGIATGASVLAAAIFLKEEKAKEIILAAPVIARDTLRDISKYFDITIILQVEREFNAVGQFYKNFPQVENEEVIRLLEHRG